MEGHGDDLTPGDRADVDPQEVVQGEPADGSLGGPAARIIRIEAGFTGPLPPPEMLAQYDAVISGGADRIVSMAEDQSSHRRRMESRGQMFGFLLALIAILGGIGLILDGKSVAGLVPLIGAMGGLAGVFVYGEIRARQARRIDTDQTSQAMPEE